MQPAGRCPLGNPPRRIPSKWAVAGCPFGSPGARAWGAGTNAIAHIASTQGVHAGRCRHCEIVCALMAPSQPPGATPAALEALAVPQACHTQPALSAWPCAHGNAHPALEVHLNGSVNAVNKRMRGCPSVPNRSIHLPDCLLCFSMGLQAPRRYFYGANHMKVPG